MTRDSAASGGAFSPYEARRFLSHLHGAGGVLELRLPKHGPYKFTGSGYFDTVDAAVEAAARCDGKANVYVTLNPVNPSLLARAVNRMVDRAETTTSDGDIVSRRFLFLDIDAVRATGISSTDDELEEVRAVAERIAEFLTAQGWPEPIIAMSGNGLYLLYRIDLPNDEAARGLVAGVLAALGARFNTLGAKVDPTVSNASRIIGVVGTKKMKGDATAERPHRRSYLVCAPDQLGLVSHAQLQRIAAERESTGNDRGSTSRTSHSGALTDILDAAGIEYREQPPDANGVTWYHLNRCPFHEDGRDFECGVGQTLPDGPYAGHCFHPEGQGRGWQDFKRALGLGPANIGAPSSKPGSRPQIVVTNRHLRDIAHDAWDALIASNDPVRFFRHGNSVAEIATHDDGAASIRHLGTAGLSGRIDRCADFLKITRAGHQPARPPRDVVEDMEALENPLPLLRGIIGSPVFTAAGVLETATGYQTKTGLYYAPIGEAVRPIPQHPDATDLRAARILLGDDLFGDFPWADEHASLANIIAALITPIVREMISGPVPLFALDAPKAGNGKGLLASCISLVATGRDIPVMADTKNEEEFRKRVTTKLMEGDAVLLFDNIRRRLDSGAFAALLTANVWSDRVLGRSQGVTLPIRSLFLVTGNNLQFSDEITRRTVSIRLDAKIDRPWEGRTFRHPDLTGWLVRHRHDVVGACLVLAQNWIAQGRPAWTGSPMGSYESWCRTLGGILQAAGIQGFLENRPDLYRRGDADSEEWRAFTSAWWQAHGDIPVKVADLHSLAEETLTSLFEQFKDGADNKVIRRKLGRAIGEREDTRFADLFVRRGGQDSHSKTNLWRVERADNAAGNDGQDEPSPAGYPHEHDPDSDSVAGDAGNAGNDFDLPHTSPSSTAESDSCGESDYCHPQYPHHPQTDSKSSANSAGDVRVTATESDGHPQCRSCDEPVDLTSSHLCGACRRDVLSRVMEGQQ